MLLACIRSTFTSGGLIYRYSSSEVFCSFLCRSCFVSVRITDVRVTDAAVATVQRVTVTQGTTQRQQQLLTVLSDRPVMEI